MDRFVDLFDFVRQVVWAMFDSLHDICQANLDQIIRLTPHHEHQRDDADRLARHHRHRVLSGIRNNRPAAAIQQHRQLAEQNEDQLNRLTQLLASNRRMARFYRIAMPALRVFQFCWGLFLFCSGVLVLLVLFGVIDLDQLPFYQRRVWRLSFGFEFHY